MTVDTIDARFQAFEERIMNQQNEKFSQILGLLKSGVVQSVQGQAVQVPVGGQGDPAIENHQKELEKKVEKLTEKIDHLLTGENESNKILDDLGPSLDKMDKMYSLLKDMDDSDEKYRKFYLDKMKNVMDEVLSTKSHVKEMERETNFLYKDIREIRDIDSKSRDSAKRSSRRNDHSSRKRRRRSSVSDRSRSSSSSDRSKSRDHRRTSEVPRPIPGAGGRKELEDLEKLMVQLNESMGVLSDKVDKNSSLDVIREKVVPQISSLNQVSQTILQRVITTAAPSSDLPPPPFSSIWDDDASPSPLRKGTPTSLAESFTREEKASSKKHKKKRRKRSASSSSSSGDDTSNNLNKTNSNIIDKTSSSTKLMDTRITEVNKTLKKSLQKVNDSQKTVLKRVDAMADSIKIIADHIDTMNDLRKELADMPILLNSNAVKLNDQIQIVLSHVDGSKVNSKGRSVTHDEYGQVTNLLDQLEVKNSEKFCEFGGLVESLQNSIVRRLEKMEMIMQDRSDRSYIETLLEISDKLIEVVKNVEKTQKKELLPAIIKLQSMSAAVKEKQVENTTSKDETVHNLPVQHHEVRVEASKGPPQELHWEDVYTKIIPSLENLTAKMNKLEDREKIETGDCNISRILAIVQELKDVRGGGFTSFPSDQDGSQDSQAGVSSGQSFSGSESREVIHKIDVVHSIIKDMREETRGLKLLDNIAKNTNELKNNSRSDAQTFSGFNTTLQSMKASMTGINTGTHTIKDFLVGLEKKICELESSNIAVETKLQTEIISGFGVVQDGLRPYLEKLGSQNAAGGSEQFNKSPQLSKIMDHIEKLISKVTKLETTLALELKNNEAGKNCKDSSVVDNSDDNSASVLAEVVTKLSGDVCNLGSELKSQLDDVHDMVYNLEEKTISAVDGVKNTLAANDKTTLGTVNNVGKLVKVIHDDTKTVKHAVDTKMGNSANDENMKQVLSNLVVITESIETLQGSGANKSKPGNKHNVTSIEQLNNKLEKMTKIINRVKFLVEKETDATEPAAAVVKVGKVKHEQPEYSSDLAHQLSKFQSSVEEELTNQSDMLADISNHNQELSDKVSTKEALKAFIDDVKFRLSDIGNGLSDLKGFGAGGGGSLNTRELEDNLAVAVTAALREDNQTHFNTITDTLEELEVKLKSIKRLVSAGSSMMRGTGEENGEGGTSRLLERVESVSRRLESVQAAIEHCGGGGGGNPDGDAGGFHTQLILEEIRKRAESESLDRLSQDLFKSMHNVQQRLLEEHKRLITKLSAIQETSFSPSTNILLQTLNKVSVSQQELLNKKGTSKELQEETNKLLKSIVDILENTHSALHGNNPGHMTRRMAELCDDLSTILNNLILTQKKMSDLDGLQELNSLLQDAASQLQNDGLISGPSDRYHPARREVSHSPASRDSDELGDLQRRRTLSGSGSAGSVPGSRGFDGPEDRDIIPRDFVSPGEQHSSGGAK